MPPSRKQEIINVCLETFMKQGLMDTSTRDLCKALNMNTGGIFYYFETKDDIIIACAEEASLRIEHDLIGSALNDIEDPDLMIQNLRQRAKNMRPLMQFFVSVCVCEAYADALQHTFNRLTERYNLYAAKFSEALHCTTEEVMPYVYVGVNTMLSYMIFGRTVFTAPQMALVHDALVRLLEKRDAEKQ